MGSEAPSTSQGLALDVLRIMINASREGKTLEEAEEIAKDYLKHRHDPPKKDVK